MSVDSSTRQCACAACQVGENPEWDDHRALNLILSRLDEQQRRWLVGREAMQRGHGGIERVAEITGMHPETIRRGRDELASGLADRPCDRVRSPGGGRPCVEKKMLHSLKTSLVS